MGYNKMSQDILLIRGDDSNFLNEALLVVNFDLGFDLTGYKARLVIENTNNIVKDFEIINNSIEISLDKIVSSTLDVGVHRCNIKLIDNLGRVKTVKKFEIKIEDEFDFTDIYTKTNKIDIDIDIDTISYGNLSNKPQINGVELIGNKTLEDLDIYNKYEINTLLDEKQGVLNVEKPLKIDIATDEKFANLSVLIDNQTIQLNSSGELVVNMDELGNEVNNLSSKIITLESQISSLLERVSQLENL